MSAAANEARPVALVGGSGFIGTRLCRRLGDSGREVVLVDRRRSADYPELWHEADVRDAASLRRCVPEGCVLVNLAAEHRDDVSPRALYDAVNVDGARNTCAVARDKGVRTIVFTSTVAVYGFAPVGTDESGRIAPFNDYGRTKLEAEQVFRAWQAEDPGSRSLVIVRPTAVFGERNRGNIYHLFNQTASRRFLMVGKGTNRKSIAYVENVAAFLEHMLEAPAGVHVYNYVDKPDFDMNTLVRQVRRVLGRPEREPLRLPRPLALGLGHACDAVAALTGRRLVVSAIRVRKFVSDSVFETSVGATGFRPPVPLGEAIERTISYEFLEDHSSQTTFETE